MALAPDCDPTPSTRQGTRALVERYHALKRRQVWAGGADRQKGSTTLVSLGPKKTKSAHASRRSATADVSVPRKKTKSDIDNLCYLRVKERMAQGLSPYLTKVDLKVTHA